MWLLDLFKKKPVEKELAEGKMWDFRENSWGHAIQFHGKDKDNIHDVSGHHTPYVSKGDTCLLNVQNEKVGVYILIEVENQSDPRDMFFGKAGMVRYATDEDYEKLGPSKTEKFRMI